MKKIKLLVVDDSILFREVLARHIRQDDKIEVVGTAGDAYSARDMILKYEPDVMTLDVEMPRMDGIAFLKKLLPQYYIPTIIVSGSEEKQQAARAAGAFAVMGKPAARTTKDMADFAATLCATIKRAYTQKATNKIAAGSQTKNVDIPSLPAQNTHAANGTASAQPTSKPTAKAAPTSKKKRRSDVIIALGASTGGTEALEQVVRALPADTPPVLIVQHMPAGFTRMYAERLNRNCKMEVKEAEDGDRLRTGLIIIGAGEHHLRLKRDARGWFISSKPGDKVSGHCPSVDVLFSSVAETAKSNAIGAILTGMGRDGAEGLLKMRNAGAFTIGQDKESCVVYGMPMEAYNIGAVDVQAPLYDIANIILNALI